MSRCKQLNRNFDFWFWFEAILFVFRDWTNILLILVVAVRDLLVKQVQQRELEYFWGLAYFCFMLHNLFIPTLHIICLLFFSQYLHVRFQIIKQFTHLFGCIGCHQPHIAHQSTHYSETIDPRVSPQAAVIRWTRVFELAILMGQLVVDVWSFEEALLLVIGAVSCSRAVSGSLFLIINQSAALMWLMFAHIIPVRKLLKIFSTQYYLISDLYIVSIIYGLSPHTYTSLHAYSIFID